MSRPSPKAMPTARRPAAASSAGRAAPRRYASRRYTGRRPTAGAAPDAGCGRAGTVRRRRRVGGPARGARGVPPVAGAVGARSRREGGRRCGRTRAVSGDGGVRPGPTRPWRAWVHHVTGVVVPCGALPVTLLTRPVTPRGPSRGPSGRRVRALRGSALWSMSGMGRVGRRRAAHAYARTGHSGLNHVQGSSGDALLGGMADPRGGGAGDPPDHRPATRRGSAT